MILNNISNLIEETNILKTLWHNLPHIKTGLKHTFHDVDHLPASVNLNKLINQQDELVKKSINDGLNANNKAISKQATTDKFTAHKTNADKLSDDFTNANNARQYQKIGQSIGQVGVGSGLYGGYHLYDKYINKRK